MVGGGVAAADGVAVDDVVVQQDGAVPDLQRGRDGGQVLGSDVDVGEVQGVGGVEERHAQQSFAGTDQVGGGRVVDSRVADPGGGLAQVGVGVAGQ
ncbi:hypothetical protein SVIO_000280 [Streptomyces violaceusniger]|uniref:Uncharacterized protein n=1 Tax=Streptomyces violaceusniger TaxID=68280 RepID=A0A4D4KKB9_STRVO|nr:hypothetical protein SVIO_000280 [Streptomyces violaceusniger]